MGDLIKPLSDGNVEDEEKAKEMVSSLLLVLKEYNFDQSMITSLPNVLSKGPTLRGPFDAMVLTLLDEEVSKHLMAIDAMVKESEPLKAERAAALETAKVSCEAARSKQTECSEILNIAQAEEKECESALKKAHQLLKELGPQVQQCSNDLDAAKEKLSNFCEGPLVAFAELKDRTTLPPQAAVSGA